MACEKCRKAREAKQRIQIKKNVITEVKKSGGRIVEIGGKEYIVYDGNTKGGN